MPYKSQAQAAYMHIHHPDIAARWDKEYGGKKPKKKVSKAAGDYGSFDAEGKWRASEAAMNRIRGQDKTGETTVNYDRSTKRNINRQTTKTTKWNPHNEFERVTTTGRQPTRWKVHPLTEKVEAHTRPDGAFVQTNTTRRVPGRLTKLGRGAAITGGALGAGALGYAGYKHKKVSKALYAIPTSYGWLTRA